MFLRCVSDEVEPCDVVGVWWRWPRSCDVDELWFRCDLDVVHLGCPTRAFVFRTAKRMAEINP